MAVSSTAIANSALAKVGGRLISDLGEDSVEANLCNEQYDKVRKALMYEHPWNFAIKRAEIAADVTAPAYGYDYRFALPADYLRILEVECAEDEWAVESGYILANVAPLKLKYIRNVTLTGDFSASFDEVLACKLAADISYSLVQSVTLRDQLYREYERKLSMARSFDAQEGSTRRVYADNWMNSRY